jgi:hypothetical protein
MTPGPLQGSELTVEQVRAPASIEVGAGTAFIVAGTAHYRQNPIQRLELFGHGELTRTRLAGSAARGGSRDFWAMLTVADSQVTEPLEVALRAELASGVVTSTRDSRGLDLPDQRRLLVRGVV